MDKVGDTSTFSIKVLLIRGFVHKPPYEILLNRIRNAVARTVTFPHSSLMATLVIEEAIHDCVKTHKKEQTSILIAYLPLQIMTMPLFKYTGCVPLNVSESF